MTSKVKQQMEEAWRLGNRTRKEVQGSPSGLFDENQTGTPGRERERGEATSWGGDRPRADVLGKHERSFSKGLQCRLCTLYWRKLSAVPARHFLTVLSSC